MFKQGQRLAILFMSVMVVFSSMVLLLGLKPTSVFASTWPRPVIVPLPERQQV